MTTTLPLIDAGTWARMSWHARQQWRAARRAAVRDAQREHEARYRPSAPPAPEPPTPRNAARRAAERIEDIEWLRDAGTPAEEIAERIGVSAGALARQMFRRGRPDLAAIFSPVDHAKHKKPCPDCGALMDRNADYCGPCSRLHRTYTTSRCSRHMLLADVRGARSDVRKAARAIQWGAPDGTQRLDAARARLVTARTNLEWHDATCEHCNERPQEAS